MVCISQVPWNSLCNALPMVLTTQVISPLLCITGQDGLFAPISQPQDLKLPLTLGVLYVGGLFPSHLLISCMESQSDQKPDYFTYTRNDFCFLRRIYLI